MSTTPRTDDAMFIAFYGPETVPVVTTSFARQLETELNDAKAKLHALQLICGTSEASRFQTSLDRLQLQLNESREREARLEKELAEAKKDTARLDWLEGNYFTAYRCQDGDPEHENKYPANCVVVNEMIIPRTGNVSRSIREALDRAASPLEQKT